jgi:hypothetical protein
MQIKGAIQLFVPICLNFLTSTLTSLHLTWNSTLDSKHKTQNTHTFSSSLPFKSQTIAYN